MVWHVHYLISPRRELIDTLANQPEEVQGALLSKLLIRNFEGDSKTWFKRDWEMKVKIISLLYRVDLLPSLDLWDRLFPKAPLEIATFDRWWTIERADLEDDEEELENEFPPELFRKFQSTGNPLIDEWLSSKKK